MAIKSIMSTTEICGSFGVAGAQVNQTWYIPQDTTFANGVIVYTDQPMTQKLVTGRTLGVTANNKNYTFVVGTNGEITGLSECSSIVIPTVIDANGFFFVGFNEYNGNVATLQRFSDKSVLWNAMVTGMFTGQSIVSTISTTGTATIDIGDNIYIGNTQLTGNIYLGYYDVETPKFIRLENSLVAETETLTAPTTITGTTVLFPNYSKDGAGNGGYGFLTTDGSNWVKKLTMQADGQTINYSWFRGNGNQFTYNHWSGFNFEVRPFYMIGRGQKVYGIPNGVKIPDMFRGTLIELLCSCDVSYSGTITEAIGVHMGNITTELNASFSILVGK